MDAPSDSSLPDSEPPSRTRGRNPVTSREAILRAAIRVVGRDGLPAASLSAIAREAGTSKAALLYHFEARENLIQCMAGASLDIFRETMERAQDTKATGADRARGALEVVFSEEARVDLAAVREIASIGIRDPKVGAMVSRVYEELSKNLAAAIGDESHEGVERASAVVAAVHGHLDRWLCSGGADTEAALAGALRSVRSIFMFER